MILYRNAGKKNVRKIVKYSKTSGVKQLYPLNNEIQTVSCMEIFDFFTFISDYYFSTLVFWLNKFLGDY